MPGLIIDVLANDGDQDQKGDTLLLGAAM